jgi:hypothetical protein
VVLKPAKRRLTLACRLESSSSTAETAVHPTSETTRSVIILYCAFTFTSWALYPTTFNPFSNFLSDLGNSAGNPSGAIFYNVGVILTGAAYIIFFGGFYKWYTSEKTRKTVIMIAQAIGFLAAFSLMMIGVFSENAGAIHVLWSLVFFILNLIAIFLFSLVLYKHPSYIKVISYYGFIAAIINLFFRLGAVGIINSLFLLIYNNPIIEWFAVFTALGWIGLLVYNMFKKF